MIIKTVSTQWSDLSVPRTNTRTTLHTDQMNERKKNVGIVREACADSHPMSNIGIIEEKKNNKILKCKRHPWFALLCETPGLTCEKIIQCICGNHVSKSNKEQSKNAYNGYFVLSNTYNN